jgi:hypothetical protein
MIWCVSQLFSASPLSDTADPIFIEIGREIAEKTNYRLVPHLFTNPEAYLLPPGSKQAQRALLLSMSAGIQDSERQRKSDEESCAEFTRCQVSKIRRVGSTYAYFDMDLKKEIPYEEYEDRYRQFITRNRPVDEEPAAHVITPTSSVCTPTTIANDAPASLDNPKVYPVVAELDPEPVVVESEQKPVVESFHAVAEIPITAVPPTSVANESMDISLYDIVTDPTAETNRSKKSKAKHATRRETLSPNSARSIMLSLLDEESLQVPEPTILEYGIGEVQPEPDSSSGQERPVVSPVEECDTPIVDSDPAVAADDEILKKFNDELDSLMSGSFVEADDEDKDCCEEVDQTEQTEAERISNDSSTICEEPVEEVDANIGLGNFDDHKSTASQSIAEEETQMDSPPTEDTIITVADTVHESQNDDDVCVDEPASISIDGSPMQVVNDEGAEEAVCAANVPILQSACEVDEYERDLMSAADIREAAMQRLTVRIDIARWKYQWELVSHEAVMLVRSRYKRKRESAQSLEVV